MDNKRRLQIAAAANPSLRVAAAPPQPGLSVAQTVAPKLAGVGVAAPQKLYVGDQEIDPSGGTAGAQDNNTHPLHDTGIAARVSGLGTNLLKSVVNAPVKFLNQAVGEGAEAYDTGREIAASATHNPTAFTNADTAAEGDYNKFFGNGTGLFGMGTFTTPAETKQGKFTTGLRKIGAGAVSTGLSILPFAKGVGLGLDAAEQAGGLTGNALLDTGLKAGAEGAGYGAAGAGANQVSEGKFSAKGLAEGAGGGALFGIGGAAAGGLFGKARGALTNNAGTVGLDDATLKYLQNEKDPNAIHSVLSNLAGGGTSDQLQAAARDIASSGSKKEILNTLLNLPQEAAGGGIAAAIADDALHGSNEAAQSGRQPQQQQGKPSIPTVEFDEGNAANGSVPDGTPGSRAPRSDTQPFSGQYDPETAAKSSTLVHSAEATPRPAGTTRLFQAAGNNSSTNYFFNNVDDLAAFKNNTTDPTDQFKFVDVPTQAVQPTPGKPGVFTVDPTTVAQFDNVAQGVSDTPIAAPAGETAPTAATPSQPAPGATAAPDNATVTASDATTPGSVAPIDATTATSPEMQADVSNLARAIEAHYTAGSESDAEKLALAHLLQNPTQALADYDQRVMQQFGVNTPNIVAGDEAKYVIPGFSSEHSGSFHEPASALAKVKYDQLLEDPATAGQPVLIMGGGTGAGKTSALKSVLGQSGQSLDDYAAVVDTNSNKLDSTEQRIQQALQSGRPVDLTYVYRDPVDSFKNGVVPRAAVQGRIVPVAAHVDTHAGALDVIQALATKYKDSPDVTINVIDNSAGKGNAAMVPLDKLATSSYTKDGLKNEIEGILHNEYAKGNITDQDYSTYLTGSPPEAQPGTSAENDGSDGSGAAAPQATPGVDDNGDIQRGVTAGVKGSPEFAPEVKAGVNATRGVRQQQGLVDNSEQLLSTGLDNATKTVQDSLAKPSKQISDQDVANVATVAKSLQLNNRFDEAADILNKTAESLTESGRAASAARLLYNSTPEGVIFQANRDLTKAGIDTTDPEINGQLQAALTYLKSTPENSLERQVAIQEVSQFVREQSPSKFGDKAFAIWRAGLLTGTQTIGKIGVSHIVQGVLEKAKDIPAVALDKFIGRFTGQRSTALTLRGAGAGARQGIDQAGTYFKTGIDIDPHSNTAELQNSVIFGKSVPGQIAQKYVDTIGRIHGSIYKPFYGAAQLNSLYDQATAAAKTAGLSGDEAEYFVEQHVANPTPDMLNTASHDAQMYTFQQETALGKMASQIQQKGGMVGKVIAPFTRIPSAIATDLIHYSPVGGVKTIIDGIKDAKDGGLSVQGQRALVQGLGRSIVGSAAVVPGLALYNAGIMTLDYPTDPQEQKLWQAEGKQENSVLIGGKWRSLGSLGPLGSVLSIGGHIGQSLKGGKDIGGAIVDGFAGGLKSIEDQSYLSGVNNAVNAIQEPGQYAGNFVKSTAASIVPTLSGTLAAATDSEARQTSKGIVQGAEDAIKNKIPGERETLPVKTDNFGNDVPNDESSWSRVFDPFQSSTARPSTPLITELQRLNDANQGVFPTTIEKSTTLDGKNTPLTDDQQKQLQTAIGQKVQAAWQKITADPKYNSLSDDQKKAVLQASNDDIVAGTKQQFAATNNLGQYAPGFAGKQAKLTQNQQQVVQGNTPDWLTTEVNKANNGTTDAAFNNLDGASKTYYNTTRGMTAAQLSKYLSSPADNNAKSIAGTVNKNLPAGVNQLPASNALAKAYADYQKAKASGNWSKITQQQKSDNFYNTAVKTSKPQLTQDLYNAGGTHAQTYINEGYVTKSDLDDAVDLDNQLYTSGLESSLKFSKTFRSTYGYGVPAAPSKDTSKSSSASSSSAAGAKQVSTNPGSISLHFSPAKGGIGNVKTTVEAPSNSTSASKVKPPGGGAHANSGASSFLSLKAPSKSSGVRLKL